MKIISLILSTTMLINSIPCSSVYAGGENDLIMDESPISSPKITTTEAGNLKFTTVTGMNLKAAFYHFALESDIGSFKERTALKEALAKHLLLQGIGTDVVSDIGKTLKKEVSIKDIEEMYMGDLLHNKQEVREFWEECLSLTDDDMELLEFINQLAPLKGNRSKKSSHGSDENHDFSTDFSGPHYFQQGPDIVPITQLMKSSGGKGSGGHQNNNQPPRQEESKSQPANSQPPSQSKSQTSISSPQQSEAMKQLSGFSAENKKLNENIHDVLFLEGEAFLRHLAIHYGLEALPAESNTDFIKTILEWIRANQEKIHKIENSQENILKKRKEINAILDTFVDNLFQSLQTFPLKLRKFLINVIGNIIGLKFSKEKAADDSLNYDVAKKYSNFVEDYIRSGHWSTPYLGKDLEEVHFFQKQAQISKDPKKAEFVKDMNLVIGDMNFQIIIDGKSHKISFPLYLGEDLKIFTQAVESAQKKVEDSSSNSYSKLQETIKSQHSLTPEKVSVEGTSKDLEAERRKSIEQTHHSEKALIAHLQEDVERGAESHVIQDLKLWLTRCDKAIDKKPFIIQSISLDLFSTRDVCQGCQVLLADRHMDIVKNIVRGLRNSDLKVEETVVGIDKNIVFSQTYNEGTLSGNMLSTCKIDHDNPRTWFSPQFLLNRYRLEKPELNSIKVEKIRKMGSDSRKENLYKQKYISDRRTFFVSEEKKFREGEMWAIKLHRLLGELKGATQKIKSIVQENQDDSHERVEEVRQGLLTLSKEGGTYDTFINQQLVKLLPKNKMNEVRRAARENPKSGVENIFDDILTQIECALHKKSEYQAYQFYKESLAVQGYQASLLNLKHLLNRNQAALTIQGYFRNHKEYEKYKGAIKTASHQIKNYEASLNKADTRLVGGYQGSIRKLKSKIETLKTKMREHAPKQLFKKQTYRMPALIEVLEKDQILDYHWYSEDEVRDLLTSELNDAAGYGVIAQTQMEHQDMLIDNVMNAIEMTLGNRVAVMPIHINGNHWIGAVFRRQNDGTLQVIVNDPMGHSIQQHPYAWRLITAVTAIDSEATIVDLAVRQQLNDDDCGPFTVENLINLARADHLDYLSREQIIIQGLLPQTGGGSAQDIRRQHVNIINRDMEAQEEKKLKRTFSSVAFERNDREHEEENFSQYVQHATAKKVVKNYLDKLYESALSQIGKK